MCTASCGGWGSAHIGTSSAIPRRTWKSFGTRWCGGSPTSGSSHSSRRWMRRAAWSGRAGWRQAEYRVELPGPARQLGRVRPSGGNLEGEDGSIRTLTFSELRRETDRLANALRALDLAPGDRVALYMPMVPGGGLIFFCGFQLGG